MASAKAHDAGASQLAALAPSQRGAVPLLPSSTKGASNRASAAFVGTRATLGVAQQGNRTVCPDLPQERHTSCARYIPVRLRLAVIDGPGERGALALIGHRPLRGCETNRTNIAFGSSTAVAVSSGTAQRWSLRGPLPRSPVLAETWLPQSDRGRAGRRGSMTPSVPGPSAGTSTCRAR